MSARPARDERGAATLLVVTVVGLLLFVLGALGVVGGIVLAQRQAQAAADLAALAGAAAIGDGADGCGRAAALAEANDASLLDCAVDGSEVTVRVGVSGPRAVGRRWDVSAQARAGPAHRPGGA